MEGETTISPPRHRELINLFVPDQTHVWLCASLESESDRSSHRSNPSKGGVGNVTVLIDDWSNGYAIKETRVLEGLDVSTLPLQNLDIPNGGMDNMTNLGYLHEASILHNLKKCKGNCNFRPYLRFFHLPCNHDSPERDQLNC